MSSTRLCARRPVGRAYSGDGGRESFGGRRSRIVENGGFSVANPIDRRLSARLLWYSRETVDRLRQRVLPAVSRKSPVLSFPSKKPWGRSLVRREATERNDGCCQSANTRRQREASMLEVTERATARIKELLKGRKKTCRFASCYRRPGERVIRWLWLWMSHGMVTRYSRSGG